MLVELTKRLKLIKPVGSSLFPNSNSLYIDDDIQAIIDVSAGTEAYNVIDPARVEMAIITHGHFDHFKDYKLFTKALFFGGPEDAALFADANSYVEDQFIYWDMFMDFPPPVESIVVKSKSKETSLPPDFIESVLSSSISMDKYIKDRQKISFGREEALAIHAPGHSPGHYIFYFDKEDLLFTADIDLALLGPWYNSSKSDIGEFIKSIDLVKEINPSILVNSHRKIYYKEDNIPKWLDRFKSFFLFRNDCIYDYLKQPRTALEIANHQVEVEKFSADDFFRVYTTKYVAYKHLEYLRDQGVITLNSDNYWVRK